MIKNISPSFKGHYISAKLPSTVTSKETDLAIIKKISDKFEAKDVIDIKSSQEQKSFSGLFQILFSQDVIDIKSSQESRNLEIEFRPKIGLDKKIYRNTLTIAPEGIIIQQFKSTAIKELYEKWLFSAWGTVADTKELKDAISNLYDKAMNALRKKQLTTPEDFGLPTTVNYFIHNL